MMDRETFREVMKHHFATTKSGGESGKVPENDEISWVTNVTDVMLDVFGLGHRGKHREKVEAARILASMSWFDNYGESIYTTRTRLIYELSTDMDPRSDVIDTQTRKAIETAIEIHG